MTFYEKNNVTENYLHEVRNHLLLENSLSADLVDEIIRQSGLTSCIEGCPYIAMHYPAERAAEHLIHSYVHMISAHAQTVAV